MNVGIALGSSCSALSVWWPLVAFSPAGRRQRRRGTRHRCALSPWAERLRQPRPRTVVRAVSIQPVRFSCAFTWSLLRPDHKEGQAVLPAEHAGEATQTTRRADPLEDVATFGHPYESRSECVGHPDAVVGERQIPSGATPCGSAAH